MGDRLRLSATSYWPWSSPDFGLTTGRLLLDSSTPQLLDSVNTNPASRAGHVREGKGFGFEKRWSGEDSPAS